MYLSVNVAHGQDDQLILAQQLGVERVVVMGGEAGALERIAFERIGHRVERAGLGLAGVELAGQATAAITASPPSQTTVARR
mgnify:CR=1 FL=1